MLNIVQIVFFVLREDVVEGDKDWVYYVLEFERIFVEEVDFCVLVCKREFSVFFKVCSQIFL